jgi:hypothetical protein
MIPRYHSQVTRQALESSFDERALRQVIRANLAQDSLISVLGVAPHHHVDDDKIAEAAAYVEEQHSIIVALSADPQGAKAQRVALGRLLHTVQDFYSHSNYVDLWLAKQSRSAEMGDPTPEQIDPLDAEILQHPDLRTGHYVPLLGPLYLVPVLGRWLARLYTPANSHEAMNLDSPSRGPRFFYALQAALKRSHHELERAINAVQSAGGEEATQRFRCG